MGFTWLKSYMPKSLYGRAALILLLPVLTLQLVVSTVFIQRHYDGVTEQMTRSILFQLDYLREVGETFDDATAAAGELARIGRPLRITARLGADVTIPAQSEVPFYDLSGRAVERTLSERLDGFRAVVIAGRAPVRVYLDTRHGPTEMSFRRSRVSASNPHQLLVIIVVIGGFMTAISYLFLRNQLRPIKRLADAADAFGKGRIETYKPAGATEVRAAGRAFLDMRARIERQTQQRTMMLSGVSHDLRTPLTRLRLGLSMLEEDTDPLQRDVADMERLLAAYLDFARDLGADELEQVVPDDLVRLAVADASRGGADVTLGDLSAGQEVSLRPVAVRRAVDNLISNAVRYGQKGRVSARLGPRSLVLSVEDDGPGIAAEDRAEAIKPFTQLDPARNQDRGPGVGLGLAIVADVARSHGGQLVLGDSSELGGLRADIVLPL